MLTGKRLIIVEPEALIALDMQRIVEEAGAIVVAAVAGPHLLPSGDASEREPIDLVLYAPTRDHQVEAADSLWTATSPQAALVLCTADPILAAAAPEGTIIVAKPFRDADVVAACVAALSRSASTS